MTITFSCPNVAVVITVTSNDEMLDMIKLGGFSYTLCINAEGFIKPIISYSDSN